MAIKKFEAMQGEFKTTEVGGNEIICDLLFLNIKNETLALTKVRVPNLKGLEEQIANISEHRTICKEIENLVNNCGYASKRCDKAIRRLLREIKAQTQPKKHSLPLILFFYFLRGGLKNKVKSYFNSLEEKINSVQEANSLVKYFEDKKKKEIEKGASRYLIKKPESVIDLDEEQIQKIKTKIIRLKEIESREKRFFEANPVTVENLQELELSYFFIANRRFLTSKTYHLKFEVHFEISPKNDLRKKEIRKHQEQNNIIETINGSVVITPPLQAMYCFSIIGCVLGFMMVSLLKIKNMNELIKEKNFNDFFLSVSQGIEWRFFVLTLFLTPLVYFVIINFKKKIFENFRGNVNYPLFTGVAVGLFHNTLPSILESLNREFSRIFKKFLRVIPEETTESLIKLTDLV